MLFLLTIANDVKTLSPIKVVNYLFDAKKNAKKEELIDDKVHFYGNWEFIL